MYHHPHGQEGKKSLSMGVLVLIFGDNSILIHIGHIYVEVRAYGKISKFGA
jgi:hypothetical protein